MIPVQNRDHNRNNIKPRQLVNNAEQITRDCLIRADGSSRFFDYANVNIAFPRSLAVPDGFKKSKVPVIDAEPGEDEQGLHPSARHNASETDCETSSQQQYEEPDDLKTGIIGESQKATADPRQGIFEWDLLGGFDCQAIAKGHR
jgi:hypothetical protein